MKICKKLVGMLILMATFQISPYVITVVNQSSQDIYYSFNTRLDRCGAGAVFPEPGVTDLKKKASIVPGKQHFVNTGSDDMYGITCEKWCFTGVNILTPSVVINEDKRFWQSNKFHALQQVAHLDLATHLNTVTGKCSDIIVYVSDDLKITPKQKSKWRMSLNKQLTATDKGYELNAKFKYPKIK